MGVLAFVLCITVFPALTSACRLSITGNHITRDGERFFLSGSNAAWVMYAWDFGNHQYRDRRTEYIKMLDTVSQAGGNSLRTWVHINGASSPKFNCSGYVTGLDDGDGSFLEDFTQYLDDAKQRNILIFPTLWNGAYIHEFPERQGGLINDTGKLQSYIDNALTPFVNAVKDHPALGGWDIINEMEGIVNASIKSGDPCFDWDPAGAGWAAPYYAPKHLARFLNWQADAIYKADPQALVTAGSSGMIHQADSFGHTNVYKDECLVKGGGRPKGVLNFYSTHCYDYNNQYHVDDVFLHDYTEYGFDKPMVVDEFSSKFGGGFSSPQQFQYLYNHGYAGAMSWMMSQTDHVTDTREVQAQGIASIRNFNDQSKGGKVALNLH